jgi:CBS domain-containing protein
MRIREVLAAKGSQKVVTVAPTATVADLVAALAEHNVGALVVSPDGNAVEGIVSERDVVRGLAERPDILDATIDSIMTTNVHTCGPSDPLDDMMTVMTERRIRHVPVVENGALVGIVSIGDVVKHKIDTLEFERDPLDNYVHRT